MNFKKVNSKSKSEEKTHFKSLPCCISLDHAMNFVCTACWSGCDCTPGCGPADGCGFTEGCEWTSGCDCLSSFDLTPPVLGMAAVPREILIFNDEYKQIKMNCKLK